MRLITLRYADECRKCSAGLPAGIEAVYEKRVGVFCPPCAPTDPEEIRGYRQEAADRRADRYEGWAGKRRRSAGAILEHNQTYTDDHAFNTQPGRIPIRARVIAQNDRAMESLEIASGFEAKADRVRHVRVAGDAEARRQAQRNAMRAILTVGMRVDTGIYGQGIVERINRKTATIGSTGTSGTYRTTVDLSFLRPEGTR